PGESPFAFRIPGAYTSSRDAPDATQVPRKGNTSKREFDFRKASMEPARIEFLEQALEKNPGNAFARYALALELARSPRSERAWEHFEYLLAHNPEYAATYLQAGMYLTKQDRREEAKQVFERGIEVTGRLGDRHAESELRGALDELADGV
ncbi:MAG: hypothetical protein ACRD10_03590, partial [Terriglobia bacterium]